VERSLCGYISVEMIPLLRDNNFTAKQTPSAETVDPKKIVVPTGAPKERSGGTCGSHTLPTRAHQCWVL
jgi:hypothetical protein